MKKSGTNIAVALFLFGCAWVTAFVLTSGIFAIGTAALDFSTLRCAMIAAFVFSAIALYGAKQVMN